MSAIASIAVNGDMNGTLLPKIIYHVLVDSRCTRRIGAIGTVGDYVSFVEERCDSQNRSWVSGIPRQTLANRNG